ncbi:MAG: MBL fold metallo-hydrolase [Thermodesulfobacteriota bacterium]
MNPSSRPKKLKLLAFSLLAVLSSTCAAQMPYTAKPHHTPDGFRNLYDYERHGFADFMKWRWQRLWQNRPEPESYEFPLAQNDPAALRSNTDKTTLTWIGHATLLFQLEGKNILTDPVFSQRASPVQWAGPKRVVPPGLAFEDLPPIDMVLISHDHYDALDKSTVWALYQRKGGADTLFVVPLGFKGWFDDLGIRKVIELDWWEQHPHKGLIFTAVPVQHWSKRSLFSRNESLWAGWVVRSERFRFFFCGDSGYAPHFKEIGARMGPFDLAAIPIGAYEPRWFMKQHHMNPEEALQVHADIKARKSVGIHWGTFILTDEPLDEPPRKLQNALKEKQNPAPDFTVLKHGETIILN